MSEDPDWYDQRLNLLVALGPVSRLDHIKTVLLRSLGANGLAIGLVKALGFVEFFSPTFWNQLWFKHTCGIIPQFCQFSTSIISDGDTSVDDLSSMRNYYGHYPAGISVKALDHTLQIYRSNRFQYYDYGKDNMEKYGSETPPLIDLSKIRNVRVSMFVGNTDLLGDPEDNLWLKDQLRENVVGYHTYDYGHITFFIGKDVSYLEDLVEDLRRYT